MLVVYDRAQEQRNRLYKYPGVNAHETMHFYSLRSRMSLTVVELAYTVNMRNLLDGQEVLGFGLDDFHESESEICVQAKDLHLYMINYVERKVVRRLQRPHNIVLKSVFYGISDRDSRLKQYEHVKELVEHEQSIGNKVLLPKINDRIAVIQQGSSDLMRIYDLKWKKSTRSFHLRPDDVSFSMLPEDLQLRAREK